jgi:precorrin-2 dehydrogenase / sirohydrochlorin ferrochelatase
MKYMPIAIDVRGRSALVVGTGAEVLSKIDRLIEAGARVTVVTEGGADAEIEARAAAGSIELVRRAAMDGDLVGRAIVFVAPYTSAEDEARARRWHAAAIRAGTLFSAIDRPEACTFVSVATVRAPSLSIAIGTDGTSPGLARRIREDLSALFAHPRFAILMDQLTKLRASLPRGERAARMAEAVEGFAIDAKLRFPSWIERGEDP